MTVPMTNKVVSMAETVAVTSSMAAVPTAAMTAVSSAAMTAVPAVTMSTGKRWSRNIQ